MLPKSWKEFRDNGFLWWINSLLHVFGWAIVYVYDSEDKELIVDVYPARVSFRGFEEKINSDGYIKLSKYMAVEADELLREALE